jgi:uncharacterized protein (TIGR03435 family)
MKKHVFAMAAFLLLLLAAVAVKLIFFPAIKDDYFAPNSQNLQKVPSGLLILRPTHFPFLKPKGITYASANFRNFDRACMVAANVSLREIIAATYGDNPGNVVLPYDAPTNNFDLLVTTPKSPREKLKNLIQKKFGYLAQREPHESEALALKIVDPHLPGLKPSGDDESRNIRFNDMTLQFTHFPFGDFTSGFDRYLNLPLIDKTGLTSNYDFTIPYDTGTRQKLENAATARPAIEQIINHFGLALEPDTITKEMLVVHKSP